MVKLWHILAILVKANRVSYSATSGAGDYKGVDCTGRSESDTVLHKDDLILSIEFGNEGEPGSVAVGKNYFYHRHTKFVTKLKILGKNSFYGWKHTGSIKAICVGIHAEKLQLQNGFTEYKTMEIYIRRFAAFADDEIYE